MRGQYTGNLRLRLAMCIITAGLKQGNNKNEYRTSFKQENLHPSRDRTAVSVSNRLPGITQNAYYFTNSRTSKFPFLNIAELYNCKGIILLGYKPGTVYKINCLGVRS